MDLNEFIAKLNLALNSKTEYKKSGWGSHNEDTWYFDCVCLIKGILWGWNADFSKKRGGAVYKSNGVPDVGTDNLINKCYNVSSDFSHIEVGELLWLKGHTGIYVGNGEVIEATAAWTNNVLKSQVSKDGTRSKDGKKVYKWKKHGFLPYVNYGNVNNTIVKENPCMKLQMALNEQYNLNLEVDGKFGSKTSEACSKNQLYKGKKAIIHIKWLQERLNELGYSCGSSGVDGHFGPDTLKAVKKYQKDHNLKVDGYVGKDTHKKLVLL